MPLRQRRIRSKFSCGLSIAHFEASLLCFSNMKTNENWHKHRLADGPRGLMFLLNLCERIKGTEAPGSARRFASTQHVGEWLSLVEHLVRDQGVGGSNPLSPTINFNSLQPPLRFEKSLM